MENKQASLLPQSTINEALEIHRDNITVSLIEVRVEFSGTCVEPANAQMQLWVSGFDSFREYTWWTAGDAVDMSCEGIEAISKEVDRAITLIRSQLDDWNSYTVSGRISWN